MKSHEKVVLITGANGGLGSAVSKAFLEAGALVVGVSEAISDADFPHERFSAISGSISAGDGARAVVDAVVARHGRVDGLVHLIGGFDGGKSVAETDDATLTRMLDINFRVAFYMIRAALVRMKIQGGGRIVAIGSKASMGPAPMVGAYAASKAALVSLVQTVAAENKSEGITANVVLPGTMDTPGNRKAMPDADFKAWIDPRQVAGLLTYLVLGDSSQINGVAIPISGREA